METLTQPATNSADAPHAVHTIALIPAYNEERFIGSVVIKARRYVNLVVVVDDGSSDETAAIAEAAGAQVLRQANTGKAGAVNAGLEFARGLGPDAVVLLDGDGQHDPADIPALLADVLAGAADMVIGSRFMGVRSNTPGWRVIGQQALTLATNVASGVALTDSQSGFRAMSRRAMERLRFRSNGFSIESEMQFLVREHALSAHEVPISVNYDEGPKRNPFGHGMQVLNGILSMVGQHRPLFFFGVPGTVLLTLGIILAVSVVDNYWRFYQLATGTAIISMTLCVLGALSVFTGIILHTIRAYLYR
jgi:glycosyltransferase involved in cell wall biosynthesis